MAKTFEKMHPGAHFTIGVSGTGGGFKKFCVGETDITGTSRPINATEVELCKTHNIDYFELPIAFDSLSIVVHGVNPNAMYSYHGAAIVSSEPGSSEHMLAVVLELHGCMANSLPV